VPLRHFVYPGNASWTEEGHLFAWRMRLRNKMGVVQFQVTDPKSGQQWVVEPKLHMNKFRAGKLASRPGMILRYAHFLRDEFARRGVAGPIVNAWAMVSMNGRAPQPLVDHTVDLAKVPHTVLGHWDFVLPWDPALMPDAKAAAETGADLE
jgi:hypothetical protein